MTLTTHQEQLLTETHRAAFSTAKMLEIQMKKQEELEKRILQVEKKLNIFMGAWSAVTAIGASVFAWLMHKGIL